MSEWYGQRTEDPMFPDMSCFYASRADNTNRSERGKDCSDQALHLTARSTQLQGGGIQGFILETPSPLGSHG